MGGRAKLLYCDGKVRKLGPLNQGNLILGGAEQFIRKRDKKEKPICLAN